MDDSIRVHHTPRGPWTTALVVLNWGIFAYVAVSALSWLAVCMMVIPYPELMAQVGEEFTYVFSQTAIYTGLSLIAGTALWLLSRRKRFQWHGQGVLAVTVVIALGMRLWMMFNG